MELLNLKSYIPDDPKLGTDSQYLIDENGRDWYESQKLFKKKYKVALDQQGKVLRSISEDVSMLFPLDCDVLEFDEIPDGCNIDGSWIFDGEKLVKRTVSAAEIIAFAVEKKATLKAAADSEIDWRQDAVDAEEASKKEISELAAWKKYRVALMRIDVSAAPDIMWTVAPE
ncbi:tail fiber assembly protein [Yersinia pseudotuberculosis]|uniref:tail fiber assembly protein n=1 Tax=Yersinia pseudotuberculosis TaxID=633 RepID=UPI0005DF3F49|nr:tail assembly chaperone [Yersinia pseudotuberculosis]CNC75804.1 tail assembly chaperone gp38 [Yersinia pseudotuberculosis]